MGRTDRTLCRAGSAPSARLCAVAMAVGAGMLMLSCNAILGIADPIAVAPPDADLGSEVGDSDAADVLTAEGDTPVGEFDREAVVCGYAATVKKDAPIVYLRLDGLGDPPVNDGSSGTVTVLFLSGTKTLGVAGAVCDGTAIHFGGGGLTATGVPSFRTTVAQSFSLEAWVKPDFVTASPSFVMGRMGTNGGYAIGYYDLGAYFVMAGSAGSTSQVTSASPLAADAWTHLVATFDASTSEMSLYVNGALSRRQTATAALPTDDQAFAVAKPAGPPGTFVTLDELAIYDKVLPIDRIAAHYAEGTSR